MINGYIFVIQKKAKNVNVYALDFQMKGEPVFKLNDETVGKWPCFGDVDNDWNHIQIYGHKSSPNMFYVETFRCLVEIEIIGSRPHFVTSYDLGSTRGAKSDRAVVVTDRSLIVASITVNED